MSKRIYRKGDKGLEKPITGQKKPGEDFEVPVFKEKPTVKPLDKTPPAPTERVTEKP